MFLSLPQTHESHEHEPHWSSESDVLGAHLSVACLKSYSGTDPLFLRKKLQVLISFSVVGCCFRGVVYGTIVSRPFLPASMWFFSCLLDVKVLLCQFLVFFQRILFHIYL